jgi:hypothetical protein
VIGEIKTYKFKGLKKYPQTQGDEVNNKFRDVGDTIIPVFPSFFLMQPDS